VDRDNPQLTRAASALVLWPIVGMVGGLVLGAIRASLGSRWDEIAGLLITIRWGVTGFFLGLALIVLLALGLRRPTGKDLVSIRRLMVLVAIAGLLSWYFARVLFALIGY
jgi:hypothetical protein